MKQKCWDINSFEANFKYFIGILKECGKHFYTFNKKLKEKVSRKLQFAL